MEKQFKKLKDGNSNAAFRLAFLTTLLAGQVENFLARIKFTRGGRPLKLKSSKEGACVRAEGRRKVFFEAVGDALAFVRQEWSHRKE